jgi:predicted transcriptional regulator
MPRDDKSPNSKLLELTAGLVVAYLSNNAVHTDALSPLIDSVQNALSLASKNREKLIIDRQKLLINARTTVTSDYIVCLEDGLRFRSLRRHLKTKFNMSPEQYRSKWNLPANYPMVAPAYSALRSQVAKSTGLGKSPRSRKA